MIMNDRYAVVKNITGTGGWVVSIKQPNSLQYKFLCVSSSLEEGSKDAEEYLREQNEQRPN